MISHIDFDKLNGEQADIMICDDSFEPLYKKLDKFTTISSNCPWNTRDIYNICKATNNLCSIDNCAPYYFSLSMGSPELIILD